ncbi:MAG: HupE/UreJ family protein [Rhizobiales bacterium]|nr:HupE/UreJ family protein [Hyphomicrobiales bacterium]
MRGTGRSGYLGATLLLLGVVLFSVAAQAHAVAGKDAAFIESVRGPEIGPFLYLGAKHMLTGYDHMLFLVGVVFFLRRLMDIVKYVTLFTIGHSTTLLLGVFAGIRVDPFLIDAVIGFSVAVMAFCNLGGFKTLFGFEPDMRILVLVFGLFHGFGLATKVQEFNLAKDGLVTNILSFNVGIEMGQIIGLSLVLLALTVWRTSAGFARHALVANTLLMIGGFLLVGYQMSGYVLAPA